MSAYNAVDGVPVSASRSLLGDVLRARWGFGGYVVTDCGAINDIWTTHRFAGDAAEASALAVQGRHGPRVRQRLPQPRRRGAAAGSSREAEIDRAVDAAVHGARAAGHVRPAGARAPTRGFPTP